MDKINLLKEDKDIHFYLEKEYKRQKNNLEMIASENFVSQAVLEAIGSILTNKYVEGYPGNRYYSGCEYVDEIENLAIERAKTLFGAEYANVQAHSGSQANMAVYFSLLKPNEKILAMSLAHGGHLTHGSPFNFSGKLYEVEHYGVDRETEMLNYESILEQAKKFRPKLIVAGASAYSREIDFKKFREIADEVGALLMVDMAHIAGLVATGLHCNPLLYADVVTSTTHKTLRGPRGGLILAGKNQSNLLHREKPTSTQNLINSALFPGMQGGAFMNIIAAKAVAFKEAFTKNYKTYQTQVIKNAQKLSEIFTKRGVRVVAGGTDNHLLNLDLRSLKITGKEAADRLEKAHITVNKNLIPFDTLSAKFTSGIRVGTPALTTRGMKEKEMEIVADLVCTLLESKGEEAIIKKTQNTIFNLTENFSLFSQEWDIHE